MSELIYDQGENPEFDRKARCVATCWEATLDNPTWERAREVYSLGFPYAMLHYVVGGRLNEHSKSLVLETYDYILKSCEVPESDYYDFWQMNDAWLASK